MKIYRKIPDSFQGDFDFLFKKWYVLEEFLQFLRLISWSLPDDQGGITCMQCISTFRGNAVAIVVVQNAVVFICMFQSYFTNITVINNANC